jgi:hypothetical protein
MGHEMDWLRKVLCLPEYVTEFHLHCVVGEPVTVDCKFFPAFDSDTNEEIVTQLAHYELVRKDE